MQVFLDTLQTLDREAWDARLLSARHVETFDPSAAMEFGPAPKASLHPGGGRADQGSSPRSRLPLVALWDVYIFNEIVKVNKEDNWCCLRL